MYTDYKIQIEEIRNADLDRRTKIQIFTLYTRDIENDIYDMLLTEEEKKDLLVKLHSYINELWVDKNY